MGVNMVRSMWLFKHKFHADGTLSRYKARLVANSSSQQLGVDFDETLARSLNRLLFTGSLALPCLIIGSLNNEFDMTDFGALNYFLGIFSNRTPTESKLGPEGAPVQDPTLYRSLTGGLQYLTFTRPDLSYAVQQICLYMHDLREPYFAALIRILRYVQGTLDLGLYLYASSTTSLVGYTVADWAGCPSTRSAKAEYWGVANVVAETTWLCNLLCELHSPLSTATLVYYDNVRVLHVPSRFQYADIFTKGLPFALFEEF
ncbi:ribonuclease H-like domain-containing protein [Tanacetum coccineum]